MNIRDAETDDHLAITDVAERSFQSSYSLSPDQITAIVESAFSEETLADRMQDPDRLLVVAEDQVDGEMRVAGFADVDLGGGELNWLHVDPEARGGGIGTRLFERARDAVADRGGQLSAWALEEATEGGEFCTQFGLGEHDTREVEFDGESFFAHVFTEGETSDEGPPEPTIDVPERVRVDGEELLVDRNEEVPGVEAPFFPVFRGEDHEERYGFLCSNCGSTDVSADGLERLECGECGNVHLADHWDDAYL